MAYSQTTASTLNDAIAQMLAFAIANAGFTSNGAFSVKKGDIYWHFASSFYSSKNHIVGRMSYANTSPSAANGQYDWTIMSAWGFAGPYPTLYLFTEGEAVHMVLEVTNGVFTHMSFGNIAKTETFNGGEFVAGMFYDYQYYSNSVNYYAFDNNYNHYTSPPFPGGQNNRPNTTNLTYMRNVKLAGQANNEADFAACSYSGRNNNWFAGSTIGGINDALMRDSPCRATMRSPIFPIYVCNRDEVSGLLNMTGYVPSVRLVNMLYLDPAEIILNEWQVFPFIAKEGNSINYPVSGNYGLAYKRTA